MTQKRLTGIFTTALGLVLLLAVVCSIPALASSDVSSGSSSSSSSNTGVTDPPSYGDGSFTVTGYTVYTNPDNVQPDYITPGMGIQVRLSVFDPRPSGSIKANELQPIARINTSSFTRYNGMDPEVKDLRYLANKGGWSYTLDFPLVYSGTGNTLNYEISYGNVALRDLQVIADYLTFNNCIEKEEDSSSEDPSGTTNTRGTGFVLKSASYGGPNVKAGEMFDFTAELLATDGSYAVDNVSVTLTPAVEISLSTGSSVNYVGTVQPGGTLSVSYQLQASAAIAEAGSYKVTLEVSGVNAKDGTEVNTTVDVTVPVVPMERFEIGNVTVPEFLMAGVDDGNGYTTVNLVNKGKGTIYNVSAKIEGDGLSTEEGNQFIGNINAGTESSADFNLKADTAGQIDAKIVITYENSMGEEKTLNHAFVVTVEEGGGMDIDDYEPVPVEPDYEEEAGIPAWVWLIVGVAVAAGVVVLLIVLRKRKAKKKAAELEDEDEEDDDEDI